MVLLYSKGTGFTGCGKTLWFEGYGLQPVHNRSKNNGLYRLRKNSSF
jgi:hypothetical protein